MKTAPLSISLRRTVELNLPREIGYLRRHDEAVRRIVDAVEMPERAAADLVMFIRQNDGTLPRNRRDDEVTLIEAAVNGTFAGS